jgi:hypothetical protein
LNGLRGRLAAVPRTLLEEVAIVVVAAAVTLHAEWGLLFDGNLYQPDALFQEYWMRQFNDPKLFTDQLTTDLRASGYFPAGLELVHRAAAHIVDPVTVAAWIPVVLVPLCAWLLFRCIRLHTTWAPAAWLGCLLFLAPIDILRFSGGHSRAFAQPIFLVALYLALRGRHRLAALVPPVGVLFYPPAALGALAMIGLSALGRRPDRERLLPAGASAAASAAIALVVGSSDLISKSEALRYPDFWVGSQFPFFGHSLQNTLTLNYSGFNLAVSGSILAVCALAVIALSPSVVRLVRREVWALGAGGLILFGLAHATLFRLYLPNRYTYALLPVYCLVIAVGWQPLWARAARLRLWPLLAVAMPIAVVVVASTVFPIGRRESISDVVDWTRDSGLWLLAAPAGAAVVLAVLRPRAAVVAAVVSGSLVIAGAAVAGGGMSAEGTCPTGRLVKKLSTLPPDAVIAGDPQRMNCIPITTRHAVVMSQKLYQPLAEPYFRTIRPRMLDMVRAYWGPSPDALVTLRRRYDARYLVVGKRNRTMPEAWERKQPFTDMIAEYLRDPAGPAVQRLGDRCLVWQHGYDRIYDLPCLTGV